jgi:uncharacterized protein (TIGR03492 family)
MSRVLFISNGHGEASIAERIARELPGLACATPEHLPLVGAGEGTPVLPLVGPREEMPSGGLVAMGNVRAFSQDLRAGFLGLLVEQIRFINAYGKGYACVVAVGDVYALALSLFTRRPIVFVGTAKSVYVAGYGPFERFLLRRAERIFVRDEPTAAALRNQHVRAEAPGNTIADLVEDEPPARAGAWIGVLPGSRKQAYEDGVRLAQVIRAMPAQALFSIAPGLDAQAYEKLLAADGWRIVRTPSDPTSPFEARDANGAYLLAWRGTLGSLLRASRLILGQAGTANEAAAACGVPIVALETDGGGWYRMRQQRLLGDALAIVPAQASVAAQALQGLLNDGERLERMGAAGQERMGKPGGARVVAEAIARLCA